jgi:hypothetical protein
MGMRNGDQKRGSFEQRLAALEERVAAVEESLVNLAANCESFEACAKKDFATLVKADNHQWKYCEDLDEELGGAFAAIHHLETTLFPKITPDLERIDKLLGGRKPKRKDGALDKRRKK